MALQPNFLANQSSVLSRQTGFFECEHPFMDKPMVWLTKPTEAHDAHAQQRC